VKKEWLAFAAMLLRATVLMPLAFALFFVVLAFLIVPPLYCLVYLFLEPAWGVAGGLLWGAALFIFRKPLPAYFKTDAKTWL